MDLSSDDADTDKLNILRYNCTIDNCSNMGDPKKDPSVSIISPLITSFAGVLGNVIALIVLYRSRKQQTKTVFYVLIGGLVWTDLVGIILTTPPVLAVYLNDLKEIGDQSMCNYHAFTMIAAALATHLIVGTMAVERFIGIRHAYFYSKHFNHTRARIVILAIYIFVLLFTALPLFKFGSYVRQYPNTWCFLDFHGNNTADVAYAVTFSSINLVCVISVVCCNLSVIFALLQMWKNRAVLNSPDKAEREKTHCIFPKEAEMQMVLLLVGITCVFTICWGPLSVLIILNTCFTWSNKQADLLAVRLASINQILDPWVYILFRKVFIVEIINFAKKLFSKQNSYSSPKREPFKTNNKVVSAPAKLMLLQTEEKRLNEINYNKDSDKHTKNLNTYIKIPGNCVRTKNSNEVNKDLQVPFKDESDEEVFLCPVERNLPNNFDLHNKPRIMFRSFSDSSARVKKGKISSFPSEHRNKSLGILIT